MLIRRPDRSGSYLSIDGEVGPRVIREPDHPGCASTSAGALDVPTPGAGLGAAVLDELLEPLGVGLDLAVVDPDGRADLLDDALGLPVDLDHHAGLGVVEPVEGDHPG